MANPTAVAITGWIQGDQSNHLAADLSSQLVEKTHQLLKTHFSAEIGSHVQRIGLIPLTRRLTIPAGHQSMFIQMNRFPSCVRNATIDKCSLFIQQENISLMKFQFNDGPRMIGVHTEPAALPIRMGEHPGMGAGIIISRSTVHIADNCEFVINICLVDPYTCFHCGATGADMPACAACKQANTYTRYCSRACQEAHRPVHKAMCGK